MEKAALISFIIGIIGLISELGYLLFRFIVYGDQKEGLLTEIWFAISICLILLSVILILIDFVIDFFNDY